VRELRRERHVAVVGQDCLEEMIVEMQRPGSPAIASISNEVALYGPKLIDLGLALLRGETVAPYNYVGHRAITADMASHLSEAAAIDIAKGPASHAAEQPAPTKRKPAKKSKAA
jgi:ribose transport system substrate-binding protein